MYDSDDNTLKSNGSQLLIASFGSEVDARECKETISALFDQIRLAVDRIFSEGGGQADLEKVAAVYEEYGLTNENGWEQGIPILQRQNEVIWPLPDGIHCSEAEDLIATMEPFGIEFHNVVSRQEPWQLFPVPESLGDPEEMVDSDEAEFMMDEEFSMLSSLQQKRILH